jgi:hypothetical protein
MDTLRFGTASATPGTKGAGLFPVAEHLDGSEETIPVVVVNGAKSGPRLWVTACEHGDEMLATATLIEFVRQLDPSKVRGTIVILPVMNSTAFNVKLRYSPLDHFNMALGWPGIANGWLSQQITHKLFGLMSKQADFVINVHNGLEASMEIAPAVVTYYESEAAYRERLKGFVESFLFRRIVHWLNEPKEGAVAKRGGSLMAALYEIGIPAFVPEVGPDMKTGLPDGLRGLFNSMRYLKMLSGKPRRLPRYDTIRDNIHMFPTRGGLFTPRVRLGQRFKKGDVLGTITGYDGNVSETFTAPADGEVLVLWKAPLIGSGDESAMDLGLYKKFTTPWPREG